MATYLGLIAVDGHGRLLVDDYGNVLVFKNKEDALESEGMYVKRLIKAKIPRKRKTTAKKA